MNRISSDSLFLRCLESSQNERSARQPPALGIAGLFSKILNLRLSVLDKGQPSLLAEETTGTQFGTEPPTVEWRYAAVGDNLSRMFAGHLGAGLLLKRAGREVSLGWLFFGAMLLDILLWVLVLAGVESVQVPKNLRTMADLTFDFPYSHSLVASLGWSLGMFAIGCFVWRRFPHQRLACALALAASVFSHFTLDWLVHIPELPVAGGDSKMLGLGLWRNPPLAWSVETALVAVGMWVYLKTRPLGRKRTFSLVAVMTLVTAMTIVGQASRSAPPSIAAMAGSSLVFIALVVWFGWWVDRDSKQARS